jgi:hypothetical protein
METEPVVRENHTLGAVRTRSLQYLNYLFWVFAAAGAAVLVELCASILERWVRFLDWTRGLFGIPKPAAGRDLWMIGGLGIVLIVAAILAALGFAAYRRTWNRRLARVWRDDGGGAFTRIVPLAARAGDRDVANRTAYIDALLASPEWRDVPAVASSPDQRDYYKRHAEAALAAIETDIANRAITAGLVVGLNRNPIVDSISILAAALELQLHVLTRLGKRPSFGTWMEMLKRTTGSLFLNWYVSREDALYLKLAIKKTAWGMGAASEAAQQAADAIDDMDWDELGGSIGVPGLSTLSALAAKGIGIGAFGLRQVGHFIESTADDLLQGVLAGGVLYYHGMALASGCLALDEEHRRSAEMTRTIGQAMAAASERAARLLRDQVKLLRDFLRERRRVVFTTAKDRMKQGLLQRFRRAEPD